MLGQPITFTLPKVVGCKLVGTINTLATSIDIVLGITKVLLTFELSSCSQLIVFNVCIWKSSYKLEVKEC